VYCVAVCEIHRHCYGSLHARITQCYLSQRQRQHSRLYPSH